MEGGTLEVLQKMHERKARVQKGFPKRDNHESFATSFAPNEVCCKGLQVIATGFGKGLQTKTRRAARGCKKVIAI